MRIFRKRPPRNPSFCDSCASVCDARCEARRLRDRAVESALRYGWRGV